MIAHGSHAVDVLSVDHSLWSVKHCLLCVLTYINIIIQMTDLGDDIHVQCI